METEFQEATCKKQPSVWHTIRAVPNQKFGSYDRRDEFFVIGKQGNNKTPGATWGQSWPEHLDKQNHLET